MKKIPGSVVGTLLALSLTLILTIWFSGCEQPANETSSSNTGGPAFTLKNESSYDLTDVTWAGVSFASPGSSDLLKGTASRREVAEDSSGYIYFTRKDTGIRLRTDEAFIGEKSPVTIGNNAVVLEIGNENNRGTLAAIGFLPAIALEYNGVAVAKDDTVSTIETPASASKQIEFVVKNTGSGVLTLSGVAPVGVTAGAFSVTQPSASTIAPGGSLPFKITFTPPAVDTYTTAVTIKSNAPSGDFTFTITGTGVSPKPVISVWYNNAEIPQNGTLNGDSVFLGLTIPVTIRNTGTALLTLDTGSITLIGTDASAFTLLSSPSPNIPVETESSFFIQFSPAKIGTHNAIITIPNNDSSKNPAVFYLQANALPLPAPSNFIAAAQSGIAINLGWDPVDGADGYRVYRSTFDGNYGTPVATVSGGTSWYDTGLSPGTAYYYKAGAYYGPIEGSLSGYVRVVTFIPVSFSDVTPDGSSTVMTTKLTLFFDQDIDGLSADDITLMPNNTGALKGALTKTGTGIYELAVNGINAGGQVGVIVVKNGYTIVPSNKQATLYFVPPAVPAGVATAVLSSSSIRVSWSAVPGAASYEIHYQKGSMSASMNYAGTSSSASYTHTGLSPETTYYYYIKAVNNAGSSAYSSYASGTTQPPSAPPSAPTGVTATALSSNSIRVSWNPVSAAASYEIYYEPYYGWGDGYGPITYAGTTSSTSYTHTGLSASAYRYYVKAVNSAGSSDYSARVYISL